MQTALHLKAYYKERNEFPQLLLLRRRLSRRDRPLVDAILSRDDLRRPLLGQGKLSPTIAQFLLPRPTLASQMCELVHLKACYEMQNAVESMEQYKVVSDMHVAPMLKLLQQLLPALTCPISTNPFSNSPDPMDRPVPYAMHLCLIKSLTQAEVVT
ncbi:hypothetical protein DUNSADRAFT_14201 [Dunaliella salina]|uniref:Uncharacterized protein n=1 Tax=Dunaliella salina TaxID=3046 RepID=A0ABQ7G7U2_DUNSA|nr:hypothetical protein DUNSADRAFT_14201 [Dunaliella salina]|eukprot:KAF5830663.1 hypothetical protein DUNSADRAFT_14201 [Dunaliella salina]